MQSRPKKRIVFAEGEEPSVIRAAFAFQTQGYGHAVLVGREDLVRENMVLAGLDPEQAKLEVINARVSKHNDAFVDVLYGRLQRQGYLRRDVQRLINQDRNSFAAAMVALGYADGMVTGVTRTFDVALEEVMRMIDPAPDGRVVGMSIVLAPGRTLFIADTNITEMPDEYELMAIAKQAAKTVRGLGYEPRVAFMSYSTFGNPMGERSTKVREAVALLDAGGDPGFEYEGEMPPDLALDPEAREAYPVPAPDRRGQRADHAGDPLRLDLHQAGADPGRGDGGGADPARPVEVGADLPAAGLGLQDPDHGPDRRLRGRRRLGGAEPHHRRQPGEDQWHSSVSRPSTTVAVTSSCHEPV